VILTPDWPAPPSVGALCTTRSGGVSRAPFDSLNLGDHVGDDPAAVAENRRRLRERLAGAGPGAPARPVFLQQVHGWAVAQLSPHTADGTEADACLSTTPGLACTVMVADCLPVLLTDAAGTVVAAAHAGWRGLAGEGGQGVLEAVCAAISKVLYTNPSANRSSAAIKNEPTDWLAWLGPCIGPDAFEVGVEVREAFCRADAGAAACFTPLAADKFLADLPALARRRLQALGIRRVYGNDGSEAWCTVSQPSRFFSHRRDAGRLGGSGRLAACIWLRD
jgi:hypothetical protein